MRLIASLIVGGALAGMTACAPPPAAAPDTSAPDENAGAPAWRCDADDARSLIGSHVGAVTFPQDANVRTACSTCPVTQDYQENRLTLVFDQETGIIERVSCG